MNSLEAINERTANEAAACCHDSKSLELHQRRSIYQGAHPRDGWYFLTGLAQPLGAYSWHADLKLPSYHPNLTISSLSALMLLTILEVSTPSMLTSDVFLVSTEVFQAEHGAHWMYSLHLTL